MLVAILAVVNVPVYLLIGWIWFDTATDAADNFFDAVVGIIKAILIPRPIRVLMGDDSGWGLFSVVGFLIACAAVVYGEHWLLVKFFPSLGG